MAQPDFAAIDRAGAWDFIRRFAADWSRPLDRDDGCSEQELAAAEDQLGRPLPAAVREAYALLGWRRDLTSIQDQLLAPNNLSVRDGRWLVYRVECQACAEWAVDLADPDEPDPPVFWGDAVASTTWRPLLARFSQACVEMVLSETLMGETDLCDNRELDDAALVALEAGFAPLGLPEYELWACPDGPSVRWFTAQDVLLRDDCRTWLWVAARTRTALDLVRRTLPGRWFVGID